MTATPPLPPVAKRDREDNSGAEIAESTARAATWTGEAPC